MSVKDVNQTARAVRARKTHWCYAHYAHDRRINPGELYVRSVIFAGHDGHPGRDWATGRNYPPRVGKLCAQCAEQYDDTKGLIGQREAAEAQP